MLTFEWSAANDCLEIHADDAGLARLLRIVKALESSASLDHVHLMTPDWGGGELDAERQGNDNKLIHHVKIFRW